MKKIITVLLAMIMLFSVVSCAKQADSQGGEKNDTNTEGGKIWDK